MKSEIKMSAVMAFLTTPLASYADGVPDTGHILTFALAGFAGSFLGALVACWFCKRIRRSDDKSQQR
jgi:uncharacterized membrane protein YfcA